MLVYLPPLAGMSLTSSWLQPRWGWGGGRWRLCSHPFYLKLCTAAWFIHQTRLQLAKTFRINWQHQSGTTTKQTTPDPPSAMAERSPKAASCSAESLASAPWQAAAGTRWLQ